MIIEITSSSEEAFRIHFSQNVQDVKSPYSFQVLFRAFLANHGDYYGKLTDRSLWILKAKGFGVTDLFPQRVFRGQVIIEKGKLRVEGKFCYGKLDLLWIICWNLIFFLFILFSFRPKTTFLDLSILIIFPLVLPAISLGLGKIANRACENKVIEFLKTL